MNHSSISTKAHILSSSPKNNYLTNHNEEIFSKLAEHAYTAEQSIDERIHEMQEAFLDIFNYIMEEEKISRKEKIVISLTENGKLEVSEHSEQRRILYVLSLNPQILTLMQRLAADALLKRGIQNIKYAKNMPLQNSQSEKIIYQTSIKGELSHFYLM